MKKKLKNKRDNKIMAVRYNPHKSTRYKNMEKGGSTRPLPELYANRENCCGCSACYAICPIRAISMEPDGEGFLYPSVDAEKCVRCYGCISVCSFKADQEARGYFVKGGAK